MKTFEWVCLATGVAVCLRCSAVVAVDQYEFPVVPLDPDASAAMPTDESTPAQWDSPRARWGTATWN